MKTLFCLLLSAFCFGALAQPVPVVNFSFETPVVAGGSWGTFANDGQTNGWSWSGDGGGVTATYSSWVTTVPDGSQAAVLYNNTTMSQSVTFPSNATYTIGFYAANRIGYAGGGLAVKIDTTTITNYASSTFTGGVFNFYYVSASISGGTHTLSFVASRPGTDAGVAIDYVGILGPNPIVAASASQSDVAAAVSSSFPGSTVIVPAGVANWTNNVLVLHNITLQGAGIGLTVITDNVVKAPAYEGPFTFLTANDQFEPRLTGFTFAGGSAKVGDYSHGAIEFYGSSDKARVDHCLFDNIQNAVCLRIAGAVYGVVDHCQFNLADEGISIWHGSTFGDPNGYGDNSWANPSSYGTANQIYIEDCGAIGLGTTTYKAFTDASAGARFTVRYCNLTNAFVLDHGTETTGPSRGCREKEVYNNHFYANLPLGGTPVGARSGSMLVFSNTTANIGAGTFSYLAGFSAYRASVWVTTWGVATGTNIAGGVWDTNDPVLYASGTISASNSISQFTDNAANWTVNQWYGYTIWTSNSVLGNVRAATITTNGAKSITFDYEDSVGSAGNALRFAVGDHYEIHRVVKILDQPGLGQGDLISDKDGANPTNTVTGQPGWPHEVSEPIYLWANTGTVTNAAPGVTGWATIVAGQDYIYGVKPGYTPLVYPHPLVGVITNQIAPPTLLHPVGVGP